MRNKIATALVVSIMIASLFVSIAPLAFAGETTLLEEFTDEVYKAPSTTVNGWGADEVSLSRVDPVLVSTYDTTGWGYNVVIEGEFAYIADGSPGLIIVNISDISTPTAAGIYASGMFMYSVAVDGDYALVAEWNRIRSVDISDPYGPSLVDTYSTFAGGNEIVIEGDWAFLAGSSAGLVAIDVSDMTALGPSFAYNTPGIAYDLVIGGDHAYVADYYSIQVINISDPTSMTLEGSIAMPGNTRDRSIDLEGDVLYIGAYEWISGDEYHHVASYDVSDPSNPVRLDNITYANLGWYVMDIDVEGNYGYVGAYSDGFYLFDASDPADLKWLDSGYDDNGFVYRVKRRGTDLFVMNSTGGMNIFNVSYPMKPTSMSTANTAGSARDVFVSGNFAYVADDFQSFSVVNITDPESISIEGTYSTSGTAKDVWVSGDYAFVADDSSGVHVLNITDPANPKLYGTYSSTGNAAGVMVKLDIAYVAESAAGLSSVDVSDPTSPSVIDTYNSVGNANGVWVSGDVAYVADGGNGLVSVNIFDPTTMALLDTFNTGGNAMDVVVDGDFAYVADGTGGLVIMDVTNPSSMVNIATYNTDGSAEGVTIYGDLAMVSDDDEGLQIINITDPWNPTLLDNITTLVDAWGSAVAGNYTFVCNRGAGLVSVKTFENVAVAYESVGTAISTTIDTTGFRIVAANLSVNETTPVGTAIYYNITNDGGTTWTPTTPGTLTFFPDFASNLRWRANLSSSDSTVTPTIKNVTVTYYFDDIDPTSSAANGAPDYDNEGNIPVAWTATDPFPGTGISMTWLYFRFDSNADGDFVDLGDISWSFSGLAGQSGNQGTFYFDPQGNDGVYEYYTRSIDNASFFEAAPAVADDSTMFDSVVPKSDCYNGAPTYVNSGTVPVWYNSSDPTPGSGIKNVTLYFRLDANNDGDFTDVGDTEWADSGLAAQTTGSGKFNFNPNGKDGRYEFFTLAADNATNIEEYPPVRDTFTIFDSKAPKTLHYIGGSLTSSGWYIGSVYVFLSAEDILSGVNITRYRVDGGQWIVYNQPFMLATDGTHMVEYYSNDQAKNDEATNSFEVKIDNGAPETSFATDPASPGPTGWFTTDVEVTLTGEDPFSGVNQTRYRVNKGNWNGYIEPFPMSNDGQFTVEFYSMDHANNKEEFGEFTLWIDQTSPSVAHNLVGNPAANGVYPSEVTVMLSATDITSGISEIEYSLDGGAWTPYSAPVAFSDDGNHTIDYRATDVAGNTGTGTVTFYIDTTPPEVSLALAGTKIGGWYTTEVTVTVTATDTGGSIEQILISVDRGVWQVYSTSIKVSGSGHHTVDAKAVDEVGHESTFESVGFKIDNKAPVTMENHAGTLGKNNWYITDVQVTLTASDDLSGIGNVSYKIDGGAWTIYSGPLTLVDDGEHKVEYFSTDVAGNKEVARSLTVKVDKTPPEIAFTSHTDGQVLRTTEVTLSGKTGADVTMTLDGEALTVGADGTFSKTITLTEGPNRIRAMAEDRAGHTTEAEIELVLDTFPPSLNIYSPSVGVRTTDKSVTIQGSTEPGSTVTVNDEPVTVDSAGAFTLTKDLEKGTNSFVIKATDANGNEVEVTRDVKVISEVPRQQTASDAMPSFILALVLVAVIIGLLAFMMGKKMGIAKREKEELDSYEPEPVRRKRVVRRPPQGPPPAHGSDLQSMESEGEFGPADTSFER